MVANSMQVSQAYMNALNSVGGGASKPQSMVETGADQGGFGDLVSDTVNQIVSTGQKADDKVIQQAVGKVDVVDVVTAVAETELAVQTLVSVRDRVISAYQDILRMPI